MSEGILRFKKEKELVIKKIYHSYFFIFLKKNPFIACNSFSTHCWSVFKKATAFSSKWINLSQWTRLIWMFAISYFKVLSQKLSQSFIYLSLPFLFSTLFSSHFSIFPLYSALVSSHLRALSFLWSLSWDHTVKME